MSDFAGNEDLLRDFLTEATELLGDLDSQLIELERSPEQGARLNAVFRSFHTIKGSAGFLGATELVRLCHLTENLFDRLRNGRLRLGRSLMDTILAATDEVRRMFSEMSARRQAAPAPSALLSALEAALTGEDGHARAQTQPAAACAPIAQREPDWAALLHAIAGGSAAVADVAKPAGDSNAPASLPADSPPRYGRRASDQPSADGVRAGRRESDKIVIAKDTIRIDTTRLDHVLNLSGELGLTKNRLACLAREILSGKHDADTLRALDESIGRLDVLVGDLQSAVMKTRMQPVGRLFQRYPRLVRDLARQLGKDAELKLQGEETELDRTMIEELTDPLMHLVRNAVDHGIETPAQRRALGKPEQGTIVICARHSGDHIVIRISDDGRGMPPDLLRRKAIEKGLLDPEVAHSMDDHQALQLILLPGFSTKDEISSISGRGVGMDVVKTNIQRLNGRVEIDSTAGAGTTLSIDLPLTLAILPVLVVRLDEQAFALPLAMVREIMRIDSAQIRSVAGKATLVVRNRVLPVRTLSAMLGLSRSQPPQYGVLLETAAGNLVLAVDGFEGRDDVVIKPLEGFRAKGIAGATQSADGSVRLVLDMEALFGESAAERRSDVLASAA